MYSLYIYIYTYTHIYIYIYIYTYDLYIGASICKCSKARLVDGMFGDDPQQYRREKITIHERRFGHQKHHPYLKTRGYDHRSSVLLSSQHTKIELERSTMFHGKTHYKTLAILSSSVPNYQRVDDL